MRLILLPDAIPEGWSGARQQAAVYTIGSLLATGFAGIAKILLARRISVTDFAEFALTLSVLQYLSMAFCDFGFVESISRMTAQATEERRGGLVRVGLLIYIPLALVFVLSVIATSLVADSVFNVKIGGDLLALAPLAVVWPFSSYVGMMYARGSGRLGMAAIASATGQALLLAAVLLIAHPGTSALTMLIVVALSNWIAAFILIKALQPRRMRAGPVISASLQAVKRWGFRAYVGRVLSIGSYNMDVLMLGALASAAAVANYALTAAVASACALPALAYGNALYRRLAGSRAIGRRAVTATGAASLLAVPMTIGMTWCLTTFVLPSSYQPMLLLAVPLGLAGAVRGLTGVFNTFLAAHGRGNELFTQGLALTVSNLILNLILIPSYGAGGAAWASLIALILNLAFHVFLYHRAIRPEGDLSSAALEANDHLAIRRIKPSEDANNSSVASRLKRIGPRPILALRMVTYRFQRSRLDKRQRVDYESVIAFPKADVNLVKFPFELPSRRSAESAASTDSGAMRIIAAADLAMAHRTDLLGAGGSALGSPIDWHRDVKSGYVWDAQTPSLSLEITRLDDQSDAKMPWEISRSHHLLALARAARVTGDACYRDELQTQLEDWIRLNPAGRGINWVNAMEVSIRAINWVWALNTLPEDLRLDADSQALVVESLRVHARHIAANLEGSPLLRGNHYLADQVGLFVLGWALCGDPDASSWSESSRAELEREIQTQVLADGMNFEASTSYHGLAIELLLLPWIVAEWSGQPLSAAYRARLESSVRAALTIRRPDGQIPLFGDNDSSRVLPIDEDRTPTYDPLLWLASGVLGTPAPALGDPDPEVVWTAGVEAFNSASEASVTDSTGSVELRNGGIWIMERGRMWLAIRCGDVGQGGTGGHSHNDALSFELALDGVPVFIDPGTFVYTADPASRNQFRSTAAHSTVQVNGLEINPIDPRALFQVAQASGPAVTKWNPDEEVAVWSGYHDGWLRLAEQVVHSRSFELNADGSELRVADKLTGSGFVSGVATLRLAPEFNANVESGRVSIDGPTSASLEIFGADGEALLESGLVASRYGVAVDAQIIRIPIQGHLPLDFGVVIRASSDFAEKSDGL